MGTRREDESTIVDRDATLPDSKSGTTETPDREPGTRIGRFTLLDRIGAGGMGVVWAALDPDLDRRVALKLVRQGGDPERQVRLLREAQAMARLSHPNVISVYEVGTVGGDLFIAMELVDGGTLGDWLAAGPRGWREIVQMFEHAGRGLAAAHAAGLVHRDFKPDNVLRGWDGRVRVTDFGLAHAADKPTASSGAALAASLDTTLTRTGALLGTPAYMAPEQHAGRGTTSLSDQFSFCVALYEALYAQRPFAGTTLPELAENVLAGKVLEPPADAKVPAWVRRAILRGLALDPTQRWPSMDALLDTLATDPVRRRRRRVVAAALAVALGAAGVTGAVVVGRDRAAARVCDDVGEDVAAIWSPARKERVTAALGADVAARVVPILDAYADAWRAGRVDACAATRVRGEQSPEVMTLRVGCLARSLAELEGVVNVFVSADETVRKGAVTASEGLTPVAVCADRAGLLREQLPPPPAVIAEATSKLSERLAALRAVARTGRYQEAITSVEAAVDEARRLGYRPREAEAWFDLGVLRYRLGDWKGASAAFLEAAWAAEAGHADRTAARAWNEVYFMAATQLVPGDVDRLRRQATVAVERAGSGAELEARLAEVDAEALQRANKLDEALARARVALARYREAHDDETDPYIIESHGQIGAILRKLGRHDEALAELRLGAELMERLHGPDHPDVASALNRIGGVLLGQEKWSDAATTLRRAVAIQDRALGPTHPSLTYTLSNLALALNYLGELDEAEAAARRAIAIAEAAHGLDHVRVVKLRNSLCHVLLSRGKLAEARTLTERSRATLTTLGLEGELDFGVVVNMQGEIALAEKRWDEARAHLEEALAIFRKTLPEEHPHVTGAVAALEDAKARRRSVVTAHGAGGGR